MVEASSQASRALGFAVLEVPEDVRPCDDRVELTADVISSNGDILHGMEVVVDLKVIILLEISQGGKSLSPRALRHQIINKGAATCNIFLAL